MISRALLYGFSPGSCHGVNPSKLTEVEEDVANFLLIRGKVILEDSCCEFMQWCLLFILQCSTLTSATVGPAALISTNTPQSRYTLLSMIA